MGQRKMKDTHEEIVTSVFTSINIETQRGYVLLRVI